jgi:hypothetical protein
LGICILSKDKDTKEFEDITILIKFKNGKIASFYDELIRWNKSLEMKIKKIIKLKFPNRKFSVNTCMFNRSWGDIDIFVEDGNSKHSQFDLEIDKIERNLMI